MASGGEIMTLTQRSAPVGFYGVAPIGGGVCMLCFRRSSGRIGEARKLAPAQRQELLGGFLITV